jgi:hypothetical protein
MTVHDQRNAHAKRHAPAVGLFVRCTKLVEGALQEICERRVELAEVFMRPFLESAVTLQYLLASDRRSARNFIDVSYRPEREMLDYLKAISRERALMPIEKRMLSSIRRHLREAGITHRELRERTSWKLDGKSMRDLLESLNWGVAYAFGFASSSHAIHPSWCDLIRHHLEREGREYFPDISYDVPDLRTLAPFAIILPGISNRFISHFHLDRMNILRPLIEQFHAYFYELDAAHEEIFSRRSA